jgi:lipid-A-disaccharide synthase
MKYFLIAGERSGDMHGANLIKSLKKKDPEGEFVCWGGDYMASAGAKLLKHYDEIAIMGLVEVLMNFRTIQRLLKKCKEEIVEYNPDTLILIDFGGFNMRIARFAHNKGLRVFYYITPKVWAWNTSRAWKIKRNVDRMFVILPFEKDFYKKFDWDVDYVGNPVVDAVKNASLDQSFIAQLTRDSREIVAVLPGSRLQEIQRMLPVMKEVFSRFPDKRFVVAGVGSLPTEAYDLPEQVELYIDRTYEILSQSKAAIVTSGTATLETALWNVPQVVGYITSPITYAIGSRLVSIDFFSLVNLIADHEVVQEFLQEKCTPDVLSAELQKLLDDTDRRKTVFEGYKQVRDILGEASVSDKTASLMIDYIKNE